MRTLTILLTALLLLAAPAGAALRAVEGGIEFVYTDPSAGSVHLAGDFNAWSTSSTPLTKGEGGKWSVVVPVSPGRHEYKFVVNGGTWVTDPDNPVTGGDYGNSIVEVAPDGSLATAATAASAGTALLPSGTAVRSNTPAQSRVVLGGFFRLLMESTDAQPNDARLRIDRPRDQFNLDVIANLNESVWGSARLQVSTEDEPDINQVGSSLYKAQASFTSEDFGVKAFYNEEMFLLDEPLGLFSGGDLRGTIEREHRPFGQGRQGALLQLEPRGTKFVVMYADTYDEDIFGPDDQNRDTATDVIGARWESPLREGRIGVNYKGVLSDWWINMDAEGNTAPADVQEFLDDRVPVTAEDPLNWFELATDQHFGSVDVAWPLPREVELVGSAGYGWYESKFDLYNKQDVQGSGQTNGSVDFPVGNEQHYRAMLGARYEQPTYVVSAQQHLYHGLGMDAGERSTVYRTQPSSMIGDTDGYALNGVTQQFNRPNNNDDLSILLLGPTPQRTTLQTHLQGEYRWREFRFGLEFTRTHDALEYAEFFDTGSGADLDRYAFRTAPSVSYRPFADDRHHVSLVAEVLQYSNPGALQQRGAASLGSGGAQTGLGHLQKIESNEFVLFGRVPATPYVGYPIDVRFDFRFIDYRGPGERVDVLNSTGSLIRRVSQAEDFFDPFVSLVYSPSRNVELEVGFGVDPRFYDVISAEGWENGRYRFRENFLRQRGIDPFHPLTQLAAEYELEERNQFVINALLRF